MGKYKGHQEFGANAPLNWREKTTGEAYLKGLSQITPPGMKPRVQRGQRFEKRTGQPQSARWHHNYDMAMFGGTDVPRPDYASRQAALEGMLNGIPRIPQVRPE